MAGGDGFWQSSGGGGGSGGTSAFTATANMSTASSASFATVFTTGSFTPSGTSVVVMILGSSSNTSNSMNNNFQVTVNGVAYPAGSYVNNSLGQHAHGFGAVVAGLTAGTAYTAAIGVKVPSGGTWQCRTSSFPNDERLLVIVSDL